VTAVRPARAGDERALATLDRATWTTLTSPAPPPPAPDWSFFSEKVEIRDVLVALVDDEVAGYIRLGRATPLAASDHVVTISGLAVDPARQRQGVGSALLDAAAREACARGARRLTLRVLSHNEPARRLYERAGFVVEGVLRGEFFLDGVYVDDVLMALDLTAARQPTPNVNESSGAAASVWKTTQ
jgi:ribosomal protein S18 acetylase RimI-like enzyme